jgi:hypothetical protein
MSKKLIKCETPVNNFMGVFVYVIEWLSFDNIRLSICTQTKKTAMLNTTLINGTEVIELSGYVYVGGIWIPLR